MKTSIPSLVVFACILFLINSCTLEKRVHSRGFNVEWLSFNKPKTNAHHHIPGCSGEKTKLRMVDSLPLANEEHALAEIGNRFVPLNQSFIEHAEASVKNQSCDVMTLRNGEEISAKVLEISPSQVKYKKCENIDGPDYYINKSDVFMIKYANGFKEVFDEPKTNTERRKKDVPRHLKNNTPYGFQTVPGMATVAFILSIGSYFAGGYGILTSIAGLILGINALNKIKRNPELYKGEGLAIAAIILSSVFLFLILLILIIVLLILSAGGI